MDKEEGIKNRTMQRDLAAINDVGMQVAPAKRQEKNGSVAKRVLQARPKKKKGQIDLSKKDKKRKNNAILWILGSILTIALIIIWILIFMS